ncbi:hypothetical protein DDJ71_06315 [Mycobacteroides abscessus]|nr:hypothetical protein DDJ40_08100 [Mycobacteroides abscessus]PVB24458.1 hypothetical protein DDJ71_06315 [Mycobacteroides abscessus]RIU40315.1 hypothetical protein D2E83_11110 [Mycobacteroides abscessus]
MSQSYDVYREAEKLGYSRDDRRYPGCESTTFTKGDTEIVIQTGHEGRITYCWIKGQRRWLGPRDRDKAGAVIHWMRQAVTE